MIVRPCLECGVAEEAHGDCPLAGSWGIHNDDSDTGFCLYCGAPSHAFAPTPVSLAQFACGLMLDDDEPTD